MSGQRAAAEPYATRFEAEVTAVDGRSVWLESTHFYAESGGQPADRGTIGDVAVEDAQLVDGEHVHVLADEPAFTAGRRVLCSIDWSFRMYCMRAHTASHVLYGAGRRVLDDLGYGGFDIGEEKVRVDLETTSEIDDETLVELDERVNRAVWESRPVSWESIPVADARERDDIAFNEATEEEAFSKGRVRIVTIGEAGDNGGRTNGLRRSNGSNGTNGPRDPWDVAACGGTHVRNTREIGPVTVLGRSNPGEGLTRVELAVGPRAIERREVEKRVTFASSRTLGVPLDAVEGELSRLRTERDELEETNRTLRREIAAARLERAEPFERDGLRWIATTVDGIDSNDAGAVARERAGELADVIVIAGEAGSPFAVVGANGSASAESIVAELTDEFGGGGGGSDALAQAGGFETSPGELVASLE